MPDKPKHIDDFTPGKLYQIKLLPPEQMEFGATTISFIRKHATKEQFFKMERLKTGNVVMFVERTFHKSELMGIQYYHLFLWKHKLITPSTDDFLQYIKPLDI